MIFKDVRSTEIFQCVNLVTQLGLIVIASILAGGFVGLLIDRSIGTKPVFTIICGVIGICGGFVSAYKLIAHTIDDTNGKAGS